MKRNNILGKSTGEESYQPCGNCVAHSFASYNNVPDEWEGFCENCYRFWVLKNKHLGKGNEDDLMRIMEPFERIKSTLCSQSDRERAKRILFDSSSSEEPERIKSKRVKRREFRSQKRDRPQADQPVQKKSKDQKDQKDQNQKK